MLIFSRSLKVREQFTVSKSNGSLRSSFDILGDRIDPLVFIYPDISFSSLLQTNLDEAL
jgi:hypothetical protein